jgi:hypothetical protein
VGSPAVATVTAPSAKASAIGTGLAVVGWAIVTAAASQPASAQRGPASRRTRIHTSRAIVASAATRRMRQWMTECPKTSKAPAIASGWPGPYAQPKSAYGHWPSPIRVAACNSNPSSKGSR